MKKAIFIAIRVPFVIAGLAPLWLGRWLTGLLHSNPYVFPQSAAYGAGFAVLATWFVLGLAAGNLLRSKRESLALINFIPAAALFYMLLWQIGIISFPFSFPHLNLGVQNYLMPLIRITNFITIRLPNFGRIFATTHVAFVGVGFMVGASFLGWLAGRKIRAFITKPSIE